MPSPSALQPVPLDPARARLADLDARLTDREGSLMALKRELQQLQTRYLREVGPLYLQLTEIDAKVVDAEIQAGLRPEPIEDPELFDDDPSGHAAQEAPASCANRSKPSSDLKRVFRDIAKAVHPDLALDEPARCRRHSLMAEANRAYAERDEDRLRLILQAWERSPESVIGDDPDAVRERVARRTAELDERLIAIEAEFADLRSSAIGRLKFKIDEARSQGWDLFGEMLLQVKREIASANARLARLRLGFPNVRARGI